MKLNVLDSIPDGFLDTPPNELLHILPGPSFIQLKGKKDPPLFVATLLHGNETTGIQAIQRLLKKYQKQKEVLPRSLFIFLGNIEAAKFNLRRFSDQPDYNRIWLGGDLPEHDLARQVLSLAKETGVFASIDVHNTSGRNPHYACINQLEGPFINLARMFSQILVYFTRPKEVLSSAFGRYFPAITIESGQPGDPFGVQHVFEFLEKCLHLAHIPASIESKDDLYIYHSMARILVPENSRIGFNGNCEGKDFCFIQNLDIQNFSELAEDSLLGWRYNPGLKLSVIDENDEEVESSYIKYHKDEIRLKRSAVPSMFTTNEKIIHQDCLGYLMECYSLPTS